MSQNQDSKVIDLIAASNAMIEKGAAAISRLESQEQAVNNLIPATVDALAAAGIINEDERKEAAVVLRDPVKSLRLMAKVASLKSQQSSAGQLGQPLGRPGQNKQAAARTSREQERFSKLASDLGVVS